MHDGSRTNLLRRLSRVSKSLTTEGLVGALGHKSICREVGAMSSIPPKADVARAKHYDHF